MKLRLSVHGCLVLVGATLLALVAACGHRSRGDWRGPSQPQPCVTDADCHHGGTCAIEMGASQGTCAGAPASAPEGDGGDPSQGPGPLVQPSPTDIQL